MLDAGKTLTFSLFYYLSLFEPVHYVLSEFTEPHTVEVSISTSVTLNFHAKYILDTGTGISPLSSH